MPQRERHTKRAACAVNTALRAVGELLRRRPVTGLDIERVVVKTLDELGAHAAFLGHGGFPAACCVSVDDVIAHGVPDDREVLVGDLVKVDVGAQVGDWYADGAWTFVAGGYHRDVDRERLYRAGLEAFYAAVAAVVPWAPVSSVGRAVEKVAEKHRVAVVKRMTGHHIGRALHEMPLIPNYYVDAFDHVQFRPGCAVAVEPILSLGSGEVVKEGWAIRTEDGQPSVHFEETLTPGTYRFFPMTELPVGIMTPS